MADRQGSKQQISSQRKALYYLGMGLIVLGFISIVSMFVQSFSGNQLDLFDQGPGFMIWGFVGMVLVIVGAVLRGIGARGLAGSGLKLDPEQGREDLAPYASAAGGLLKDVAEGFQDAGGKPQQEQIKVRCRHCRALNQEDAKFCDQCGKEL